MKSQIVTLHELHSLRTNFDVHIDDSFEYEIGGASAHTNSPTYFFFSSYKYMSMCVSDLSDKPNAFLVCFETCN